MTNASTKFSIGTAERGGRCADLRQSKGRISLARDPTRHRTVARRDGSAERWFPYDLESSLEAQESNVA
jgi:hypothetical protein